MPLDALVSGRVATFAGDHGFGWVEAVGIRGGRVAFAGSAVELETRADPHTLRIELEPGEIAIPGLTDAHLHLLEAAAAAEHVDLTDAATLGDGLALLATTNSSLPAGSWLLGAGWDQRRWGRWPTAADLAAVTPGRPAALWSFDHHAVWASPEALAIAGLDLESPDPDGGIIRRLADGSLLLVSRDHRFLSVWDAGTGRERRPPVALSSIGIPTHLAVSPDGRWLAIQAGDMGQRAYRADLAARRPGPELVWEAAAGQTVGRITVDHHGHVLVTPATWTGEIAVVDARERKPLTFRCERRLDSKQFLHRPVPPRLRFVPKLNVHAKTL